MHNKYNDLFDTLVKSYYEGDFDTTLNRIITCHESSPQETFEIITSLCGVKIEFDNNYLYNLKKAITHYTVQKKVVEKLQCCSDDSCKGDDNKYNCQRACPFDAIYFDEEKGSTEIDGDKCLGCGICIDSCKSGRILDKVQYIPIIDLIKNNKTVIAAVAPAISGQFGDDVTMDQLRAAFIQMGFTDMIEVAFAADILSIKEAVEFNKHVKGPNDLMITSCCCPMWVGMLKKVYNELIDDLSPSVSPMVAAGRVIKKLNPDAKVVFVGPCIAKKAEAKEKDVAGAIDFILTFQEVDEIFNAMDIRPRDLEGVPTKEYASKGGRLYARTGGVSVAVHDVLNELYPDQIKNFKAVQANGVIECKKILNSALNGEINASFLEGMGCVGGCVGGPKANIPTARGKEAVDNFAKESAIQVPVHSDTLDDVLGRLGIESLKDFEDKDKIQLFEREF